MICLFSNRPALKRCGKWAVRRSKTGVNSAQRYWCLHLDNIFLWYLIYLPWLKLLLRRHRQIHALSPAQNIYRRSVMLIANTYTNGIDSTVCHYAKTRWVERSRRFRLLCNGNWHSSSIHLLLLTGCLVAHGEWHLQCVYGIHQRLCQRRSWIMEVEMGTE